MVAYNMSKAAIDQFTRTVALEVADRGVRVNAVNPGLIITDIHRRAGISEENYQKVHKERGSVMCRVSDFHGIAVNGQHS